MTKQKKIATKTTVKRGARSGAGRPRGSGKFGDAGPTKPVRIPVSLIPDVEAFIARKIKAAKKG